MRLAQTDPMQQIPEAIGSGPFKFIAGERIPGSRVVFAKNEAYVPRKDGTPSFNAGPKIVNVDRVVWNFIPDPATASAALQQGEIDWWENPALDLLPQIKILQGHHRHRQRPHRRDRMPAVQSPASALQQPCDPPRGGRRDGPEGGHGGCRRRRTVTLQNRYRPVRSRNAHGEHRRRRNHPRP